MPEAVPDIPYDEARRARGAAIHQAHSMAQADVFEYPWPGGRRALLKDFNGRPALVRWIWSAAICAREVRALRRLDRLDGVPHLFATAGRYAFVMERIEGDRLPKRGEAPPPPEFWDRARALIDRLHAEGISHGDLRRKNIMIGPAAEAYLIDFATAARERRGGLDAWLSRTVFRYVRRVDRATFVRIKESYAPDLLDATDLSWLADAPWQLAAGRWLKRNVYALRKPGVLRKRLREAGRWVRYWLGLKKKRPRKKRRTKNEK